MVSSYQLQPLTGSDHVVVREIYADVITYESKSFYTKEQLQSWSSLAWLPGVLDKSLIEGRGWISLQKQQVEAFAVRYPLNRLALLYCRSRATRRGHATALLNRVELEASEEGQTRLVTEASLFSYPLLLKCGWIMIAPETIEIAGVSFEHYLMKKNLKNFD